MARQIKVHAFRIGRDLELNKFGDYDVVIHAMSRDPSGTGIPSATAETYVMISSIGAPPKTLLPDQFKELIVNAVMANAKPVDFPAV
jgi:hypothetical protein